MKKVRDVVVEDHYKDNYDMYVKIVARRVGNNYAVAEEIVQEAYTRSLRFFSFYNPSKKPFGAWFNTILNNTVRDVAKDERLGGVVLDDNTVATDDRDMKDYRNRIKDEIEEMVEGSRKEILELYFTYGLMPKDIVQITEGNTVGSVKQVLVRFKNSMQELVCVGN